MMSACIRKDKIHSHEAFHVYEEMKRQGFIPNRVTLLTLLKACVDETTWIYGKMIHDHVVSCDLYYGDLSLATSLVNMYGRCGDVQNARLVFNQMSRHNSSDHVLWTTMISVYSQCGLVDESLSLFRKMLLEEGITPTEVTFVAALGACVNPMYLEDGKFIHMNVSSMGFESNVIVATALVSMYGKCGSLLDAKKVFEDLPMKDVVSWNALLSGYAQHGFFDQTLEWFRHMKDESISPDSVTFNCVLKACGNLGFIEMGEEIYGEVKKQGLLNRNVFLCTTIVDMYAKCGMLEKAQRVFDDEIIVQHDIIAWNALIGGYAQEGNWATSLLLYEKMKGTFVKPDGVTFTSILTACCHGGLVEKGIDYLASMSRDYSLSPEIGHYSTVLDLLGKAGDFVRVRDLLSSMPIYPNLAMWLGLLGACQMHGNVKLARHAYNEAVHLQPKQAIANVLVLNIYADADPEVYQVAMD